MERHELLEMMAQLKLAGMRAAYDDILADGLKRRHPVQQIVGALLKAEIADKKARSIKYQMTSARLPTAKELADFDFTASPVNQPLIQELAAGNFLESQRNVVLVGGTGTGKTHLAVAVARSCIRKGARGRCYNVVDLVNHLEAELRAGRQGRIAEQLVRRRLRHPRRARIPALRTGRRPAPLPPHEPALRANLHRHHNQPRLRRVAVRLRRPQDDHGAPRSSHPPLRDHRDRQRELALQEPILTRNRPRLRPGCPGGPTGTPHAASLPRSARRYTKPRGSPLLATGTTSAVPLRGVNFARR